MVETCCSESNVGKVAFMKRATCSSLDMLTFSLAASMVMSWMGNMGGEDQIYTCRTSQAGMAGMSWDALILGKP